MHLIKFTPEQKVYLETIIKQTLISIDNGIVLGAIFDAYGKIKQERLNVLTEKIELLIEQNSSIPVLDMDSGNFVDVFTTIVNKTIRENKEEKIVALANILHRNFYRHDDMDLFSKYIEYLDYVNFTQIRILKEIFDMEFYIDGEEIFFGDLLGYGMIESNVTIGEEEYEKRMSPKEFELTHELFALYLSDLLSNEFIQIRTKDGSRMYMPNDPDYLSFKYTITMKGMEMILFVSEYDNQNEASGEEVI